MSDAPSHLSGAIFLSYAREDAEAARRVADALRAFGIEVWFDQSELRGGDAWDAKIRRQIRECALFVPIISQHTQKRGEGYFRREWKLGVERTHDMAERRAFIVPVVIDDVVEKTAEVPEEFLRYQWTRLPHGVPSTQFVDQVRTVLAGSSKPASTPIPVEKSPAHRRSGPSTKPWRAAAAVLAVAVVAGAAWWQLRSRGSPAAAPGEPVVVLMDSPAPDRVYDPATLKNGGTNADDLTHVLADLPISFVKESTSSAWDREAEVVKVNPTLVVVHRSCFYTFPNNDARFDDLYPYAADKLLAFIGYLATVNPRTRFLVYSRGSWDDETAAARWRTEAVTRFPALAGRVETWRVPRDRATFRDPLTGREMRENVERLLGLTAQPRKSK